MISYISKIVSSQINNHSDNSILSALWEVIRVVETRIDIFWQIRCMFQYYTFCSWCLWRCFWLFRLWKGLEKTLESPLDCKEIKPVHPKGIQSRVFIGRTDADAEAPILWPSGAKEPTNWKRPWCWERLRAGEGDNKRWDSWMASPTRWIWVWATSGSWWRTGRTGVLQSMGSQRVGHDLVTEHPIISVLTSETKLNW